ncbi:MAG: MFS transporter [Cypionkella sp.]
MAQADQPIAATTNRGIAVTLALSMLLASLGTSIANIALPVLGEQFSAPFQQVQWVVVAYLASLTICVVIVGRLGDRFGLRRVYLAGIALFAVAALLTGLAQTLGFLIGARALQGIGAAVMMTLTMALMRERASSHGIGRAMGLLGTVSALGTALGPVLGGMLLATVGWRGIFVVQSPLALLALVLAMAFLPPDARKNQPRGAWLSAQASISLLPNFAVNLVVAAVMMTTLVVGPFYLGIGLGLDPALVGLVMAVGPVISIVSGVPSGRLVDTWGAGVLLGCGLGLMTVGSLLISVLPALLGVAGYVAAIAVLTPGYQLFQAANNTAVMADIASDRRGVASGLLGLSRNIGLILGASVMGWVFARGVGTGDLGGASPLAIVGGMQMTFFIAGGLMLAASCLTLITQKRVAPDLPK